MSQRASHYSADVATIRNAVKEAVGTTFCITIKTAQWISKWHAVSASFKATIQYAFEATVDAACAPSHGAAQQAAERATCMSAKQ